MRAWCASRTSWTASRPSSCQAERGPRCAPSSTAATCATRSSTPLRPATRGVGSGAAMCLLARRIGDGGEPGLPLVGGGGKRNAFGRQLGSFAADLDVPLRGDAPVHGGFIRAPVIEDVGPGVDILARTA